MKTRKYIRIVILLVILLSACNGNEPNLEAQLQGKTWVLKTYNDTQPIAGRYPTLNFEGDQISRTTGCNHYGGAYQIKGDALHFEEIFSTEMACLEPDGLMEQERIYLELLRTADQFQLTEHELVFYTESNPILVFEIQLNDPVSIEPNLEPENPVVVAAVPSPTSPQVFEPPERWNSYQDSVTGISVYIPRDWIVTGIIEGEYAILQSYPEDKYVGGEMREEGDTKCDLSIRPEGDRAEELIEQWKSNSMTTIIADEEFIFQSGFSGRRFVIDSMGQAMVFIAEFNRRVILLTCFGNFTQVDEIAKTIKAPE